MSIKVSQSSGYFSVKIQSTPKLKVSVATGAGAVAQNLSDLADFDSTGVSDKYLVMYDATTKKYTTVNPDIVLTSAVTEPTNPGLPASFIDQLDIDLDNKIDLDAGSF